MASIDRRSFLSGALSTGAALIGACGSDEQKSARGVPGISQADGWDAVREQFDLSPDYVHLSSLYITSHPRPVREAIDRHRRSLDEMPVSYLNREITDRENRVLDAAAEYLSTSPRDIGLTDSTTMGLGIVYNGIHIGPGQEFLTTQQNYFSTDEALRLKAQKSGAHVRRVPLYQQIETVSEDEIVNNLLSAVGPATRVVALTWVHSSTGLKLPLRRIADGLEEINASRGEAEQILLCVDGVHGFGVENVTMADLGCDFFIAGCHKWLFGPRGTGIVCGSERGWQNVSPTIPTFMDDRVRDAWVVGNDIPGGTNGRRISPGGFKAFEHQWAMAEAFDFHLAIGKERVAARTHELARQMKEGLAAMPHVRLYTPMSEGLSSGIVCFDVEGTSPHAVVDLLYERRIIATVTPYADPSVRVAPSIRNSAADIDAALRAIRELA